MAVEFHLKFAVVDAARDLLHRAPFVPFRLRLHDGVILKIENPDMLSVSKARVMIFDDGHELRTLNPALISSIDRTSGHD
jgi:hypothetical protein